jgi:hypothetical protein
MSITLDDKAVDVFKSYEEMAVACSKDIEDYKTLLKSIEEMITQKQRNLQNIKDKTVGLVKTSLEITQEISLNQPAENFDYAGVDMVEDLTPEAEFESEEAVAEEDSPAITPPKRARTQKTRPANRRKAAEKGRVKRADKSRESAERSQNIADIRCLHHPEASVTDVGRQLCSSCRWKLINNGLLKFDKEPEVIAFLKGEIKNIPNMGQPMCPIHQSVPSYNQKTGLCKACQSKAKAIGVENRQLTKKELTVLRNPAL